MDVAAFDYDLPESAIAQAPVEPETQPGCWSTGPVRAAERPDRGAISPGLLGPGDLLVVNDTRVLPARLQLRKATGGAVEVLLLERQPDGTWDALVRPVAAGAARHGRDGRRPAVLHRRRSSATAVRLCRRWSRRCRRGRRLAADTARCPCRPTSTSRWPTRSATRPSSPAARGRWPRRPPGCISPPTLLDRCRAAGAQVAAVELAVGLGHVPRRSTHEAGRGPRGCTPSDTACRTATMEACASGPAGRRGRHDRRSGAGERGRHRRATRGGPSCSSERVPLPGGGRPAHELPRPRSSLLVLVDAFIGPRWRDLYATALERGYRFLSFGDAMLLPSRRPVTAPGEAHGVEIEAARRRRPAIGRVTTARGAIRRRRASCRSARGRRCGRCRRWTSRTLGAADHARQHLPPDAAAGRRAHRRAGRPARVHGLARPRAHRLRWLPDLLADPKVDDEGATFRSTYDGSRHHLTPEACGRRSSGCSAPTSRWCSTSARRCRRHRRSCAPRWSAPPRGPRRVAARSWPARRRRTTGGRPGAVRHRAGRRRPRACGRESAERTVEVGFDGYGIGGLSVGEPRDEMLPALGAATAGLPADQPRYLMGVGDPIGLVEGIALGVDMFDCVLPTRYARHGTILTDAGRLHAAQRPVRRRRGAPRPDAAARPAPAGPAPTCATCSGSANRPGPAAHGPQSLVDARSHAAHA